MDTKERIEWIDVAKGIGIVLVIMGHTFALKYSQVLYTFHMPLFFFLSGLFVKQYKNFYELLEKSCQKILRPWFVMILISLMVVITIPEWRHILSLKGILVEFYTANTNLTQNSSLWYLVCFFVVTLLFYPLDKIIQGNPKKHLVILILLSIAILWLKEILVFVPIPEHRLPFKSDTALVALVFYAVGFYAKNIIMQSVPVLNIRLIFILFVLWAIGALFNGWTNLNSYDFGKIKLFFYPIAFMGIAVCCGIAYQIAKNDRLYLIKRLLSYYGRNSLLIFGFQSLFIRLYLLTFNHLQDLDMKLYSNNPLIHQVWSFVVVTFIFSPVVVFVFNKLRQYNIRII